MKYKSNKARTMLANAQDLVYTLQELMPTKYQKENLEAMLGLFLQAQGHPLPEHSKTKSASPLHGIRKLKYHAITGLSINRKLVDGRILRKIQKINCPTVGVALSSDTTTGLGFARKFCETVGQFITCKSLRHLHKQGQQVNLVGLKFPVTVAWYYLKRENGRVEKRFVLSTKPLKASTIKWWGKRRWQIEGWFKTAKHRFGLHRFGQSSLLGMYRWLILSFLAYFIVHWTYLSTQLPLPPDWGEAAQTALESFFCSQVVSLLLLDINRLTLLARSCGWEQRDFVKTSAIVKPIHRNKEIKTTLSIV